MITDPTRTTTSTVRLPPLSSKPEIGGSAQGFAQSQDGMNTIDIGRKTHFSSLRGTPMPTTAHSLSALDSLKKVTSSTLRDFVKRDSKQKKQDRSNPRTDISHMKDLQRSVEIVPEDLCSVPSPTQCLPTSLRQLEKFVENSNSLGIQRTDYPGARPYYHTCLKDQCIDEVMVKRQQLAQTFPVVLPKKRPRKESDLNPFLTQVDPERFKALGTESICEEDEEFVYLGNPTGRQDVENLGTWFKHMKEKHLSEETFLSESIVAELPRVETAMVIYNACMKELVRQVAVSCVERGQLLQEVLVFYNNVWIKFMTKAYDEFISLERNFQSSADKTDQEHAVTISSLQARISALEKSQESVEIDLADKIDECFRLKKRMQDIHETEKKMLKRLLQQQQQTAVPEYAPTHLLKPIQTSMLPTPLSEVASQSHNTSVEEVQYPIESEIPLPPPPQSTENILEEFVQDKGVGDSELFELVNAELQTEETRKETEEKETQTDTIEMGSLADMQSATEALGATGAIGVLGATGVETMDKLKTLSINTTFIMEINPVAAVEKLKETIPNLSLIGEKEIENPSEVFHLPLISGEDQSMIPVSMLKTTDVTAPQLLEGGAKCMTEDSYGGTEQTPTSNLTFDVFPTNISHVAGESDSKITEETIAQAKKKLEAISHYVDEKEMTLRQIQAAIAERKQVLGQLDTALVEKQQLKEQLTNELEVVESEYKSIAQEKQELERTGKRGKNANSRGLNGIAEMPETDEALTPAFLPEGADLASWKAGYSLGLEKGWSDGMHAGEDFGYERAVSDIKEVVETKAVEPKRLKVELDESKKPFVEDGFNQRRGSMYDAESPRPGKQDMDSSDSSMEMTDEARSVSSRGKLWHRPSILKMRKRGSRVITQFAEFSFQHPELSRIWKKRTHPAPRLLDQVLQKPLDIVLKSAVMSRKMLFKFYSQVYFSADQRLRDGADSLLIEVAYDEIDQKFVLKKVVEKKVLELIASSINAADQRKAKMFMRLIGAGTKIDQPSFSKHSVRMYLNAFNFMMKSKVGIVVGVDETADVQLFPLSRAIECLKEHLSQFDWSTALPSIQSTLEKQAVSDLKRLNKTGLIELELVFELLLQEFDARQQQVQDSLKLLLEALAYSDNIADVTVPQFLMMVRHVSPGKLDKVLTTDGEAYTNEVIVTITKPQGRNQESDRPESRPGTVEEEETIAIERIFDLSIEMGLFTKSDMDSFFGSNWDMDAFSVSEAELEELEQLKSVVFSQRRVSKDQKTESENVWKRRLSMFRNCVSERSGAVVHAGLILMKAELLRLRDG